MHTFVTTSLSLLTIPLVHRLTLLSLGYEPRALSMTQLTCTDDVLPDTCTYDHRRLDFCAVVQRRLLPLSPAYHSHSCTHHAHFCACHLHSPGSTTWSTPHYPPVISPTGHRVTTLVRLPWADFQPSG